MVQARWTTALLLCCAGIVCAPLAGCHNSQAADQKKEMPPPTVFYSLPQVERVTDSEDFTGHTAAVNSVTVKAHIGGFLDKVNFKDGDEVKAGQVLAEIDPRPFQDDFNRNEALVAQAQQHLVRLDSDFKRAQKMLDSRAISQEQYDQYHFDYLEGEAALQAARAARESSKQNLDYTKVLAQISGRVSNRKVDPGNDVTADVTEITTIVSEDPIYAYFDVDENTALRLRRLAEKDKAAGTPRKRYEVSLGLTDEKDFPHKGTIDFTDNIVDPQTGTERLRGVFPNPTHFLLPGLFIRARLPIGEPHDALVIPDRALASDQGRKFVYVIDKDSQAVYRSVTVGQPFGDGMRVIVDGLSSGERVVVSGLQRIMKADQKVEPKLEEPAKDKLNSDSAKSSQPASGAKAEETPNASPASPAAPANPTAPKP